MVKGRDVRPRGGFAIAAAVAIVGLVRAAADVSEAR
jgi:hypothetical protein